MERKEMMSKLTANQITPNKLIPELLDSVRAAHLAHLDTTSYAKHMALGTYYEDLPGLIDSYVESYIGYYGRCSFSSTASLDYKNIDAVIKSLHDKTMELLKATKEPDLSNLLQEITAFMKQTLYRFTLS